MEKRMDRLVQRVLTGTEALQTKVLPDSTLWKRFEQRARFVKRNQSLTLALEATARFAVSLNYTKPYWLTLSGVSGTGKTHLAKAVRKQFLEWNRFEHKPDYGRNRIVGNTEWFCDWRQFADDIRGGGYDRLVQDACDEWLLIVDDFGAERDPSGFIAAAADRILNSRRAKWTLLTTNLGLDEIGRRMDVRIASRLVRDGNEFVTLEATDYALHNV
jgi:DNA replication protein DnaC